jgi:type I restriction enzyme S subunit
MNEDWIESTLGEVCFTTSGGTPSRKNKLYYEGKIPWIKSGELNNNIILDSEEHITEEALKKSSAKIFPKGTLLFALYGATIGKMATLGIDASTNQAVCGIYKSDAFNSRYLYNYLLFQKNYLIQQGIGGAQPNISQTILKKLVIPIPSLVEQKLIVDKIEELITSLDSGISDLKKSQDQLIIYRQAVLKKMFEGSWEITALENIAKWGSGGTPSRKNPEYYTGIIPWLKTGELGQKYVSDTEEKITQEALSNSSAKIFPANSVGIAMYGATIGKVSILLKPLSTNQACAVAQPYKTIDKEYLYYYLASQKYVFISKGKGGAQPNISQTILKSHPIPLPNINEQRKIVQEIESRLSVCDKVEESIADSLRKAIALRQSIFNKAFEGKLLSKEEKAKCKKHKDYEPASVLLKRIRAEKKQK